MNKSKLSEWEKELDSIQRDIWAGINDELQKRGVKLTIGDAYSAGSSIKEVLHPRVSNLLQEQRKEIIEEIKKMKMDVPSEPTVSGEFTDEFVNQIILYAGRFNYNEALNHVAKELKSK